MDKRYVSCFTLLLLLLFSLVFVSLVYGKLGVKQASSLPANNGIRKSAVSSLVTLSDVVFRMIPMFILFDFL